MDKESVKPLLSYLNDMFDTATKYGRESCTEQEKRYFWGRADAYYDVKKAIERFLN